VCGVDDREGGKMAGNSAPWHVASQAMMTLILLTVAIALGRQS